MSDIEEAITLFEKGVELRRVLEYVYQLGQIQGLREAVDHIVSMEQEKKAS